MSKTVAWILAVACAAFTSAAARGQQVGVVDMERLIKAHPDTESSLAVLKKQVADFESEQKKMLEEREQLKDAFEEARKEMESSALSDEARLGKREIAEGKLKELKDLELEIRKTAGLRQKQLTDQELRMRDQIVSKIRDLIRKHADEKGLLLVVNGSRRLDGTEAVAYSADRIDITEAILKTMGAGEAK